MTPSDSLLEILSGRLPSSWWRPQGRLGDDLVIGPMGFDRGRFLAKYAAATRKLGSGVFPPVTAPEEGASSLSWLLAKTTLDELGRVGLLVLAAKLAGAASVGDLAEDCFRHGDNGERRGVLRSLSLLPSPDKLESLAAHACRTHVQTVFEALCCENPYPAAFFDELPFNQMVLKALFTGVSLARIMGLDRRRTPELWRMASDYAAERRAAGRSVPPDLDDLDPRR